MHWAALLPLLAAAPATAACTGTRVQGSCFRCGNPQTCIVRKVAPSADADACCAKCGVACKMWSWNGTSCTTMASLGEPVPEPFPGDCVSGYTSPPAPVPTPAINPAPAGAKNVLYIVVDDLRPELAGGYDQAYVHSPRLAKFAAESLVFQRAYCQYALCGPSRNSFMTGRRPDSTTAYNFGRHFRMPDVGPDWTSMPEHFKNSGYLVLGSGKLYHPNVPPSYDMPRSWSPENGVYLNDDTSPCIAGHYSDGSVWQGGGGGGIKWCAINDSALEPTLGDRVNSQRAIDHLRGELSALFRPAGTDQRPFFIAMGFHKPHLPFAVPERFYALQQPADQVALPKHPTAPAGMPAVAFNPTANFTPTQPMPDGEMRRARRAYMAAISYTDGLVGEVLDALDATGRADDTLVSFHADHGWQLGEHGEWRKMTNFELGVRVPLMVRVPWKAAAMGKRARALVELVDMFPTVTELAGIPPPSGEPVPLEGSSVAALFDDPTASLPQQWALSQYTRCPKAGQPEWQGNSCPAAAKTNNKVTVMGYSLRVDGWRYTEWAAFDGAARGGKGTVDWSQPLHGVELYPHGDGDADENDFDAEENTNVADRAEHAALVAQLSAQLRALVANTTQH